MTNNLNHIRRQCEALMTAHGVGRLEFEFSKCYRAIAMTKGFTIGNTTLAHKIVLSRRWALVLPEEEILQIMLHEIAHALTPHGKPHGREFQRMVRSLGGFADCRTFRTSVLIDGTPRP